MCHGPQSRLNSNNRNTEGKIAQLPGSILTKFDEAFSWLRGRLPLFRVRFRQNKRSCASSLISDRNSTIGITSMSFAGRSAFFTSSDSMLESANLRKSLIKFVFTPEGTLHNGTQPNRPNGWRLELSRADRPIVTLRLGRRGNSQLRGANRRTATSSLTLSPWLIKSDKPT